MFPLIDGWKIEKSNQFYEKIHKVEMEHLHFWKEHILWEWEFWISLALTVLPWVFWSFYRKRGSEARLLFSGFFVIIVACFLDFIGVSFGLWHYTGKVLPFIPSYFPWDFSLIPVTMMFWLQVKPNASVILKAVSYAGLTSFVGEPFFGLIGLYCSKEWSVFYSFPIYIVIYILAHRLSRMKSFDSL